MAAIARLGAVTLDCSDPPALAAFYAELTGGEIAFSSEGFVAVQGPAIWITTQLVEGYSAPTWPGGAVPKQVHLDFGVDDLDAAQAAAVAIGARLADEQPGADGWRVLLDPAGHPFCLTTLIPAD